MPKFSGKKAVLATKHIFIRCFLPQNQQITVPLTHAKMEGNVCLTYTDTLANATASLESSFMERTARNVREIENILEKIYQWDAVWLPLSLISEKAFFFFFMTPVIFKFIDPSILHISLLLSHLNFVAENIWLRSFLCSFAESCSRKLVGNQNVILSNGFSTKINAYQCEEQCKQFNRKLWSPSWGTKHDVPGGEWLASMRGLVWW